MGTKDNPACVDYVLSETGETQLKYVGFSMGCTSVLVLTSMSKTYNDKVSVELSFF